MKKEILKPRKTGKERKRKYKISVEKRIKKYIKDGGEDNLDLYKTPVEKLPDNLQVGGYLNLMRTPIEELPDNLKVGSGLYLTSTPIKKLPDSLKVSGHLSLKDTSIKELPDNLQVGVSLDLRNTPLSKKYSEEEIRNMIEEKGGYVKGYILT